MPRTDNPLIVQSNRTLLLDVHAPLSEECRNALIPFAELVSSPEHLHTYQITPLSLWNAAGAGFSGEDAVAVLEKYSRYDIPQSVIMWIKESAGRFGKLRLVPAPSEKNFQTGEDEEFLYLVSESPYVYKEIEANPAACLFRVSTLHLKTRLRMLRRMKCAIALSFFLPTAEQ